MNNSKKTYPNSVCLELAVSVSDFLWNSAGYEIDKIGGICHHGMSAYEFGCSAMEAINIYGYNHEKNPNVFSVEVEPSDVRTFLSEKEFSENEFNELFLAFCFRTIEWCDELGAWEDEFVVPETVADSVSELEKIGFIEFVEGVAGWTSSALPWLLFVQAVDFDFLEEITFDEVSKAWVSLPPKIKEYMTSRELEKQTPYAFRSYIQFICSHQKPSGWDDIAGSSTPNQNWNVRLTYSLFRYAQCLKVRTNVSSGHKSSN